jgi:2-polyprenyl-3-methyl-5-hydroxy-6-metoxy-1,4-benzoquinol methylase
MTQETKEGIKMSDELYSNYFEHRGVDRSVYHSYSLPVSLKEQLPADKSTAILDIGCGYGQMLSALGKSGYKNLYGLELLQEAADYCNTELNLNVTCSSDISLFSRENERKFDLIIMSHVLEHIPKDQTIDTLKCVKRMLTENGKVIIMVPNGQAPVHSYWMWEDFTHYTLFTAGSISYVLKAAGFKEIEFLDPHDLMAKPIFIRVFKFLFQKLYRLNARFWNSVNSSGYHYTSPVIYTWELKVSAQ